MFKAKALLLFDYLINLLLSRELVATSTSVALGVLFVSGCSPYDMGLRHEKWKCSVNYGSAETNYIFLSNQPHGNEIRWIAIDGIPVSGIGTTSVILKTADVWMWSVPNFANPMPRKSLWDRPNNLNFTLYRSNGTLVIDEINDLTMTKVRSSKGQCVFSRMDEPYP